MKKGLIAFAFMFVILGSMIVSAAPLQQRSSTIVIQNVCEKLVVGKEACWENYAINSNNATICQKAGRLREDCYMLLGISQKNSSVCNALPGNSPFNLFGIFRSQRTRCIDTVETKLALEGPKYPTDFPPTASEIRSGKYMEGKQITVASFDNYDFSKDNGAIITDPEYGNIYMAQLRDGTIIKWNGQGNYWIENTLVTSTDQKNTIYAYFFANLLVDKTGKFATPVSKLPFLASLK